MGASTIIIGLGEERGVEIGVGVGVGGIGVAEDVKVGIGIGEGVTSSNGMGVDSLWAKLAVMATSSI